MRHAGGRVIRAVHALRSFVSASPAPAYGATASARSAFRRRAAQPRVSARPAQQARPFTDPPPRVGATPRVQGQRNTSVTRRRRAAIPSRRGRPRGIRAASAAPSLALADARGTPAAALGLKISQAASARGRRPELFRAGRPQCSTPLPLSPTPR